MNNCDVLMLCHDVDRGVEYHGQLYSQLIDSVRLQLVQIGCDVNVMSHPYSAIQKAQIFGQTYTFNRKHVLMKLRERFKNYRSVTKRSIDTSPQHLFWSKIMRTSHCKVVVLVGAPNALCAAAFELKIPVVELLHGYGYHQIPWGYENRPAKELPTHFISFDLTSFKTFKEYFDFGPKTYFSIRPTIDEELRLTRGALFGVEQSQPDQTEKINVLLSLGWMEFVGSELQEISKQKIWPRIVDELEQIAADEIQWYIRPHPVMLRDNRFRKHIMEIERRISLMDNCSSIEEATTSLPNLLVKIDAHLTSFSEIAFEAAFAGVPTLFLSGEVGEDGQLRGRFNELFSSGSAEILDGEGDVALTWLRNAKRVNPTHLSSNTSTVLEILQTQVIPLTTSPLQ